MKLAISEHANEVYASLPDDRHRQVAERLFRSLTVKGEDNRGIRRPTRVDQLAAISGEDGQVLTTVIEAYRKPGVTFLMPGEETPLQEDTVIDLSHESLMRVWQRLRRWVDTEAQSARIYRRLVDTARLLKGFSYAIGTACLVAIALAAWAMHQSRVAQEKSRLAQQETQRRRNRGQSRSR